MVECASVGRHVLNGSCGPHMAFGGSVVRQIEGEGRHLWGSVSSWSAQTSGRHSWCPRVSEHRKSIHFLNYVL